LSNLDNAELSNNIIYQSLAFDTGNAYQDFDKLSKTNNLSEKAKVEISTFISVLNAGKALYSWYSQRRQKVSRAHRSAYLPHLICTIY
jgi:hypothetical protein